MSVALSRMMFSAAALLADALFSELMIVFVVKHGVAKLQKEILL